MKAPLTFKLPPGYYTNNPARKRRKTHSHNIPYARHKLTSSGGVTLSRQYYSGFAFYLELITYYVKRAVTIELTAKNPCLIFIYAINSDLTLTVPGQADHTVIPKGYYFAHSLPAGTYIWPVETGKKKFVYFILRPGWLLKMKRDYPELSAVIQKLQDGESVNQILQPFPMTVNTVRQMTKLRTSQLTSKADLEVTLLDSINKLIAEYHAHLTAAPVTNPPKSSQQIACEARDLVIEEVEKGLVPQVAEISGHFKIGPKVLRRNCQKTFHMNFHEIIIDARMKAARRLLIGRRLKVKDVAEQLGYADAANFSRAFKRYFGYYPNKAHSTLQ